MVNTNLKFYEYFVCSENTPCKNIQKDPGNIMNAFTGLIPLAGIILAYLIAFVMHLWCCTERGRFRVKPFADAEWYTIGLHPFRHPIDWKTFKEQLEIGEHRFIIIVLIIFLAATSLFLDACRTNCNIKLQEVQNRYNNKKKEVDALVHFETDPIPLGSSTLCQHASNLYNIVDGASFGCAPKNVQTWWGQSGGDKQPCNTKPIPAQAATACKYPHVKQELSSIQKELDPLKTLQTSLNNIHYCFIATVCILPISWFFLFKFLSIYRIESPSKGACMLGWANVALSLSLLIPIGIIIYTLITNFSSMKKQLHFILFIVTIVLLSGTIAWIAIGQGIFHPVIMGSRLRKSCRMAPQTLNEPDAKAGEGVGLVPPPKQFNMNDPAVYLMERVL